MRRLNKWYPYVKQLKNRSSKNNNLIGGRKCIMRYVSGEQLKEWEKMDVAGAYEEIARRSKRRGKNSGKNDGGNPEANNG